MSLNSKLLALSLACTLAIVGCNKKEQETQTPSVEAEKPVVAADTAPNCDDASIKNSLIKALAVQISGQVETAIARSPSTDGVDLERLISQRLNELSIDLQNANVEGDVCHIDVIVNLTANDVKFANQYFASTEEPSLAERAKDSKISLDKNNRLIIPVSYQVIDGQAVIAETSSETLSIIADTVSASAHAMANSKGTISTNARPALEVEPLEPVEIPKPVKVEPPKTDNTQTQPKAEPKPETAPKKPSEPAQEPRPVAEPKPEPKEPAPVTTNSNEISIVETDETY